MKWLSVDPANKSGLAYWEDDRLIDTTVLRKLGAKGRYTDTASGVLYETQWDAWLSAIFQEEYLVCEEGCGRFATAIKSQSDMRGFIRAACMFKKTPFAVINVSEWRRVIKEAFGISWPATTERKKALSVQLVKSRFNIDVTDDEADAVLIGVAAMRMGLVNVAINQEVSK